MPGEGGGWICGILLNAFSKGCFNTNIWKKVCTSFGLSMNFIILYLLGCLYAVKELMESFKLPLWCTVQPCKHSLAQYRIYLLTQCFNVFLFSLLEGKEVLFELQCFMYTYPASIHETRIWKNAD